MECWAPEPLQLFSLAGHVLFQNIVDSKRSLEGRHSHHLRVDGADWADLMVNWLRELLFLWHGQGEIAARITIERLTANQLHATIATDAFNPNLHSVLHEIKAVTYHQIQVGPCEKGWCARVIFDV